MTDVDKLLKMIWEVDPNDTEKLDEIDARVNGLLCGGIFIDFRKGNNNQDVAWYRDDPKEVNREHDILVEFEDERRNILKYTRSRDALKAIRPKGWRLQIKQHAHSYEGGLVQSGSGRYLSYKKAPTEELAELHAIIQAIKYERDNND